MIGRIHNIYKVTQAQKERKKNKNKNICSPSYVDPSL